MANATETAIDIPEVNGWSIFVFIQYFLLFLYYYLFRFGWSTVNRWNKKTPKCQKFEK